MCLLVSQPKTVSFTDEFLTDVYGKNRDGLGIMYAEAGKLHVYKCLPANAQDFVDFYRKHGAKRDCIWHARMRTHGDIDKDNCHPYHVTDHIYLAHNGILSSGNDADRTKSDTWHFIKHVMRPALTADPDLMLDDVWLTFIGDLIGNGNKFGLMRSDGKSAIINKSAGLEFMQSWVSNTYAWSPSKFGVKTQSRYAHYQSDDAYESYWTRREAGFNSKVYSGSLLTDMEELEEDYVSEPQLRRYVRAAYNQWQRQGISGLEQWAKDAPGKAAALLVHWYNDLQTSDVRELVEQDPEEAAVWIEDLFRTDSISPRYLA